MSKTVWWGASVGSVLAILVIAYGFLLNATALPAISEIIVLVVCPPSLSITAADTSSWYVTGLACLYVIAANAALYALVFALFGAVRKGLRKEGEDEI